MSPEIDYTRQRTVAELLAEHGDGGPGGRRHRRRGEGPDGPVPPPPPVGRRGPDGRPYPPDAGPGRPPRQTPDAAPPGYRGGPPPRPAPGGPPVTGRRDRPTEMIGDRQRPPGPAGYSEGPYGPGPSRGAVPNADTAATAANGAERTTASGPVRAVSPVAGREARPSASGPLRAVPTTGGPGTRDGAPRPNGRSTPARTAPPASASGSAGRRAAVERRPGRSLGSAARGAVGRPGFVGGLPRCPGRCPEPRAAGAERFPRDGRTGPRAARRAA